MLAISILRGTTAENEVYVGGLGQLTMDTERHELRLHDGVTVGGHVIGDNTMSPADILTALKTVDGVGSTLDADLLDGKHLADIEDDYSLAIATALTAANTYTDNTADDLTAVLLTKANTADLTAHTSATNNPHNVTADQLGLGAVQNYGIATLAEATAGTVNNKYMTPQLTKTVVDNAVAAVVDAAPGTLDTLNELAAALGDDPNFAATVTAQIASRETPAGAQAKVDAHADLTNNPHEVTKAQVGLGSVENYGIATESEAVAGTSNAKYLTPLRMAQYIQQVGAVAPSRQIVAGNGLTGGGNLTIDRTLSLATPGTLSGTTTNEVQAAGHTHALSANLKAWDGIAPSSKANASALSSYLPLSGGTLSGGLGIHNTNPTITMRNISGRSAFIHNAGDLLYILRGDTNGTAWDGGPNGRHPMTLNLATGSVTFSGDSGGFSDARLKKDVEEIQDALAAVLKMRGVYYTWIDTGLRSLGFIAQEMLEVAPDLVGQDEDGYYYIKYDRVTAYLAEAVKTQQTQLDVLAEQNRSLQRQLQAHQVQLQAQHALLTQVTARVDALSQSQSNPPSV